MATLKCIHEGREGFHVGDLVEVPGDPDAVDPYFIKVEAPKTGTKTGAKDKGEGS